MKKLTQALSFIAIFFFAELAIADPAVYNEQKTTITVSADQPEFIVKLKSNPTTGYSWFLREYDASMIKPIKHSFAAPADKKLMGAPGYQLWTFQVLPKAFVVPQQTMMRFVYVRPWQSEDEKQQIVFKVTTISSDKSK